jgi:hypothetical protein
MAFLCRHPDLASIYLEPDSIRASSLTTIPASPNAENKVVVLTAPSPYIPYLLSAAPSVHRVTLLFTLAPTSTRVTLLRPAAFDLPAYRTALAALATLPGTHPLALNLTFRVTALSLPWIGLPDPEALDSSLFPETRLTRVHALWLHADGLRFNAADIRALVRWLGLFPSLQRLTFAYGAVEKIPQPERAALAQAICSACSGINTPTDIAFNIKDN